MKRFGWTLFILAPVILLPTLAFWIFMIFCATDVTALAQFFPYWIGGLVSIPLLAALGMVGGWALAHPSGIMKARLPVGFMMLFFSGAVAIYLISTFNVAVVLFIFPLLYFISVLIGGLCLIVPGGSKKLSHADNQPPDQPEDK